MVALNKRRTESKVLFTNWSKIRIQGNSTQKQEEGNHLGRIEAKILPYEEKENKILDFSFSYKNGGKNRERRAESKVLPSNRCGRNLISWEKKRKKVFLIERCRRVAESKEKRIETNIYNHAISAS